MSRCELAEPRRDGWIANNGRSRHARHDLLKQLQPFRADAELERGKAGGIAARPSKACDESSADRIGDDHEHDRHGVGRLEQGTYGRAATC